MFDFRRITLFCLGYRLLKKKNSIYSYARNWGAWPAGPPTTPMGERLYFHKDFQHELHSKLSEHLTQKFQPFFSILVETFIILSKGLNASNTLTTLHM